jgi:hypothetical protein
MGAPRKNPPSNAVVEIRSLAAAGSTYVGIAKRFRVSKDIHKYRKRKPDIIVAAGPEPIRFIDEAHHKVFHGCQ